MPIKPTPEEAISLNLTPMIDVVFLLVIFFMAATRFKEIERSIELELPRVSGGAESAPAAPRQVTIDAQGQTYLDGQPVTPDGLQAELSAELSRSPELQVLVNGDARADFQHVAAALAACRQAGVTDLGVTVEVAARPSPSAR